VRETKYRRINNDNLIGPNEKLDLYAPGAIPPISGKDPAINGYVGEDEQERYALTPLIVAATTISVGTS
jgi:hypothetical protein